MLTPRNSILLCIMNSLPYYISGKDDDVPHGCFWASLFCAMPISVFNLSFPAVPAQANALNRHNTYIHIHSIDTQKEKGLLIHSSSVFGSTGCSGFLIRLKSQFQTQPFGWIDAMTLPVTRASGMGPNSRESRDAVRLSPTTQQ